MGKLVVSQFVTLDGVMESPEEWNINYANDLDFVQQLISDFDSSEAVMLGRTTYEFFAERWPSRVGELADKFNAIPKYVVSKSLKSSTWNSTVIQENVVDRIRKIKDDSGRDILVLGSYRLLQTLFQHQLIDEFKLYQYPLLIGKGKRLFEPEMKNHLLGLISSKCFHSGIVGMHYEIGNS